MGIFDYRVSKSALLLGAKFCALIYCFALGEVPALAASGLEDYQKSGPLQFETVVIPGVVSVPSTDEQAKSILVALKITNIGDSMALVNSYQIPVPCLLSSDKKNVLVGSAGDHVRPIQRTDFVSLAPHHTTYIVVNCHLEWFEGKLRLGGEENTGMVWNADVKPGRYLIALHYFVDKEMNQIAMPGIHIYPWVGDITTKWISIEIKK